MEAYIGTKFILAKPMTRGEYNQYRGWTIPEGENPDDEGYLVEYLDSPNSNHPLHNHYISWSPKDVFECAYRKTNGEITFGVAIEAAKAGKKIARKGWNGQGIYAYYIPFTCVPARTAIEAANGEMVSLLPSWALRTAQGEIATWSPSGTDSLAEDWIILD